jgi:hypothetical protein
VGIGGTRHRSCLFQEIRSPNLRPPFKLHCHHIYLFRSKSLSATCIMAISNSPLNSTGRMVSEFQNSSASTTNQHSIMRKASEEIE